MQEYGLIGRPLSHSFSPRFFARFFAEQGIDACYKAHELQSIEELPELLDRQPQLIGLNVTMPYKEEVLQYCHFISPEVSDLQAANVLYIQRTSEGIYLEAYNSDVLGFRLSLEPLLLGRSVRSALVLGTGGAARAVAYALCQLGISYRYVSRSPSGADCVGYDEASQLLPSVELVINASPVGYDLSQAPTLDYSTIGPQHICYDLIYNPEETRFLSLAKAQGALTKNGQEMLERQALEAWRIWQTRQARTLVF